MHECTLMYEKGDALVAENWPISMAEAIPAHMWRIHVHVKVCTTYE